MSRPSFGDRWAVSKSLQGTLLIKPVPGQVIAEVDPSPDAAAYGRMLAAAPELRDTVQVLANCLREFCPTRGEVLAADKLLESL